MKKLGFLVLLFFLFIVGGIILAWYSDKNLQPFVFTGLIAYVLVILVPWRFLKGLSPKHQYLRWVSWIIVSLTFSAIWSEATEDKTIFLYVTSGILFWIMVSLISSSNSARTKKTKNF